MKKMFLCILCILCLGTLVGCLNRDDEIASEREVKVKDMIVKYDPDVWKEVSISSTADDSGEIKAIEHKENKFRIVSVYSESNYYVTTANLAKSISDSLKDAGITPKENTVGEWAEIQYEGETGTVVQRFYADNYDTYSVTFMYTNEADVNEAEKVFSNIKFDDTAKKQSEKIAKEKLIGEWEWKNNGYFVIDEEKLYYFMDSSKDMNNVRYGTYEATDKVATYGSGYINGMTVIVDYEKSVMDGEVIGTSGKGEFVFIENADGSYSIQNMVTSGKGPITKVK